MSSIVQNDTRRPVVFRLKDTDGSPIDLTGESLEVKYRISKGALKTAALAVPTPTNGYAKLMPAASNWDAAGVATGRVRITTGGKVGKTWIWTLEVEKDTHAV